MQKKAMSAGGCLFTLGTIGIVAYAGIYRAVTGHLPSELMYWLWGLIALSIVTDVYFRLSETIEESSDEITDKLEKINREITETKEQCKTLNWKLDAFKTEFDDVVERTKSTER